MDDIAPPAADEVEVRLTWSHDAEGDLHGRLEVRNVGHRTIRVGGKPVLTPLGEDGQPFDTVFAVTAEFRLPGYVELAPGQRAGAPVAWAGWDGPPASGRVRVEFDGVDVDVVADGPAQPLNRYAGNLSSSWFDLLPD